MRRAERAGRVLDQLDALGDDRAKRLPVDRSTEEVDGHDGSRPAREHRGHALRDRRETCPGRRRPGRPARRRAPPRSRSRGTCTRERSPRRPARSRAQGRRGGAPPYPDETAAAWVTPTASAIARSNSSTFDPIVSCPLSSTLAHGVDLGLADVRAGQADVVQGRRRAEPRPIPGDRAREAVVELHLAPRSPARAVPSRCSGSGARRRCSAAAGTRSHPDSRSGA